MSVDLTVLSPETIRLLEEAVERRVRNGGTRLTVQEMADLIMLHAQRWPPQRPS